MVNVIFKLVPIHVAVHVSVFAPVLVCACNYTYVCLCIFQTAFEVLGFISVMSNCWLLLLSPRVREFCLEGGISGRNIILFAILVEVQYDYSTVQYLAHNSCLIHSILLCHYLPN